MKLSEKHLRMEMLVLRFEPNGEAFVPPILGLGKDLLELAVLGVEHTDEEDPDVIAAIVHDAMPSYRGDAYEYEL